MSNDDKPNDGDLGREAMSNRHNRRASLPTFASVLRTPW